METNKMDSPSEQLTKVLTRSTSSFQDPHGPRFMVPTAPDADNKKHYHGLRKMVQRLFNPKPRNLQEESIDQPLVPEAVKRASRIPRHQSESKGSTLGRTISNFGSRLMSNSMFSGSLLGKTASTMQMPTLQSNNYNYSVSMDDLGVKSTPASPISNQQQVDVEDRLRANHQECMRTHNTCLPISQAEACDILARERAESCRLAGDDQARLYLVPVDPDMAKAVFLSRSQVTRIGRNADRIVKTRSRVVSRNHCQFFSELTEDGQRIHYVVDVGSHSGTFVNGMRLSIAGTQSSPYPLQSGDIVQLGVDYSDNDGDDHHQNKDFKSIQWIVMIGHQLKTVNQEDNRQESTKQQDNELIPAEKANKLYKRTLNMFTDQLSTVMWIQFGDILHDNAHGSGMFARQSGGCYAYVFNNYRLTWEIALSETQSSKSSSQLLYCECAVGREDVYIVRQSMYGEDKRRGTKIARISVKPDFVIVTLLSDKRPVSGQQPALAVANQEEALIRVACARPASPYLSMSKSSSPLSSPLASPRLAPMLSPSTGSYNQTMIKKPTVPYYVINRRSGLIHEKDRNDGEKEKLIGQGKYEASMGKWGRRQGAWKGNVAPGQDDMIIVLGMLIDQLANMA